MVQQDKKLYLSILWHQHQPFYKTEMAGAYRLPWVFLHAIKDYYEMGMHVLEAVGENPELYSRMKVNFNYVPSLVKQLKDYEDPGVNDLFICLLRKPVSQLQVSEKTILLNQLVMINRKTMVREFPRLDSILDKYDKGLELNSQEILDLSVLYLIAWTGIYFRKDKHVKDLVYKNEGYTEFDKLNLLNFYAQKVKDIIPLHNMLEKEGLAELSFTPFYHPIMPLLADFSSACEAMPDAPMPEFSDTFGNDYLEHLDKGYKHHIDTFNTAPNGVWPSEGSVSPLTVDAYIKKGLKWVATDEDILARTACIDIKKFPLRKELYKKHVRQSSDGSIRIFFRDKTLSDLIGFTYSSWDPRQAVDHFISKLKEIYDICDFPPHVSVILDGENAWEYYENNAFDFFKEFYKRLLSCDWICMQTFSEAALNKNVPEVTLGGLASGSWINGNFAIWCGHREKNLAWELLSDARKAIDQSKDKLSPDIYEEVREELMVAEGSDWFWWYGDDHFTKQNAIFDELFRGHLANIYNCLGVAIPDKVHTAIKKTEKEGLLNKNFRTLSVILDGKNSFYTEWLGAGTFDLSYDEGSMHSGGKYLKFLKFGYDDRNFYFSIQCEPGNVFPNNFVLGVNISGKQYGIKVQKGGIYESGGIQICCDLIIEGLIPLDIMFKGTSVKMFFTIDSEGAQERAPRYNDIEFKHPSTEPPDWAI